MSIYFVNGTEVRSTTDEVGMWIVGGTGPQFTPARFFVSPYRKVYHASRIAVSTEHAFVPIPRHPTRRYPRSAPIVEYLRHQVFVSGIYEGCDAMTFRRCIGTLHDITGSDKLQISRDKAVIVKLKA